MEKSQITEEWYQRQGIQAIENEAENLNRKLSVRYEMEKLREEHERPNREKNMSFGNVQFVSENNEE